MSYGSSSGIPGPSHQADTQQVQKKLLGLLQHLRWSYVTLWSLNHQSRSLEWTGGHFMGNTPAQSDAEVWNGHLFNMQKTCTFSPGQGSVGIAFANQRNTWMNGSSVHRSAGSEVQAQILRQARIETAVYIPSAGAVLELGTSESVAEDSHRVDRIRDFMWEHILPALDPARLPVSQSPLAPILSHDSHEFLNQDFELNEQIRRSSSLNTDMFLQHPDDGEELATPSSVPHETTTWISSPTASRPTDLLRTTAANQALMRFQEFRSLSGTTSSSLSSLEDSTVKLSVDSPEQSISLMASSSQRHGSHSHHSPSARRETPSQSPDMRLLDTRGVPGPLPHLHDIQQAIRHMLDEGEPQGPWSQMIQDPSPVAGNQQDSAFNLWQHSHVLHRSEGSPNQRLLLRSFEILRHIPNQQQGNPTLPGASAPSFGVRLRTSSSSPEDPPEQDEAGPSSGQRRPSRGGVRIGTPGSGQDEAAKQMQHMWSERRRRQKQKENFAALRKLVPIISKNDKASILADAIIYLKDLQVQIQELQASAAAKQKRYETLELSHQVLQERNRQLEDFVAATSRGAATSVLPPS